MVKYYLKTSTLPKTPISRTDFFYIKSLLDRRCCSHICIAYRDKKCGLNGQTFKYNNDGGFVQLSFMIFNNGVFN